MQRFNHLMQHPNLQALAAHNQTLDALSAMWQTVVPTHLGKLCFAKQMKNGQLSVSCTSSAVAAKIKLLAPSLLIQLQNQGYEVTAIHSKVQVISSSSSQSKPSRTLSPSAKKALQRLALQESDSALGIAIGNIIRHAKP